MELLVSQLLVDRISQELEDRRDRSATKQERHASCLIQVVLVLIPCSDRLVILTAYSSHPIDPGEHWVSRRLRLSNSALYQEKSGTT